jgi:hypothetical protein
MYFIRGLYDISEFGDKFCALLFNVVPVETAVNSFGMLSILM